MRLRFNHILLALTAAIAALLTASCAESPVDTPEPPTTPGASIRLTTGSMLPQIVTSRAAEAEEKTDEEQRINTVHIFFFDSDGNFLTPTNPEEFAPYIALDFTTRRPEALAVASDAFENQETTDVHIVAVANIHGSRFLTDWTPDGDIVNGDPDDPEKTVKITSVNDLYRWVYRPTERKDISRLPDEGMPMVGELTNAHLTGYTAINVHLTALMARVDVNIRLNALQINADEGLPQLVVNSFGIKNLPRKVSLFNPSNDRTVTSDSEIIANEQIVEVKNPVVIRTDENEQTFTYYTYENLRDPENDGFQYPEGVADDPAVRQRWKPQIADRHASALIIHGTYTTHQNLTYRAQFTFYLGDNTVDNFEVRRNRCYKNDIAVRGLDFVRNSDDNLYTFDARVNVATDNPVFISLVNERRIDSHWSVVPMDIYFLENAPAGSTVDVEILDPATSWIRLDYCDASAVNESEIKAGWGCADYFYEDMFTRYPATTATARNNRDRVYFYVDENASTKSREAHIRLTYTPGDGGETRTQTVEFLQAGLLPFTVDGTTYYMESYEEYAEHRDPLDIHAPSPWYQPAGIPWAREGTPLNGRKLAYATGDWKDDSSKIKWYPLNTIDSDGKTMSEYILGLQKYDSGNVDNVGSLKSSLIYSTEATSSAIYVATSKNKRNENGTVNSVKWFLPGISELEGMMSYVASHSTSAEYIPLYDSCKQNFYWSASTARNPNYNKGTFQKVNHRENPYRARATKLDDNNSPIRSVSSYSWSYYYKRENDEECSQDVRYPKGQKSNGALVIGNEEGADYEDGYGRTLRTQPLRVRAIRVADGVTTD